MDANRGNGWSALDWAKLAGVVALGTAGLGALRAGRVGVQDFAKNASRHSNRYVEQQLGLPSRKNWWGGQKEYSQKELEAAAENYGWINEVAPVQGTRRQPYVYTTPTVERNPRTGRYKRIPKSRLSGRPGQKRIGYKEESYDGGYRETGNRYLDPSVQGLTPSEKVRMLRSQGVAEYAKNTPAGKQFTKLKGWAEAEAGYQLHSRPWLTQATDEVVSAKSNFWSGIKQTWSGTNAAGEQVIPGNSPYSNFGKWLQSDIFGTKIGRWANKHSVGLDRAGLLGAGYLAADFLNPFGFGSVFD